VKTRKGRRIRGPSSPGYDDDNDDDDAMEDMLVSIIITE